ncbi:MAG: hypothetical protein Unbinned706contig1000_50 [Prokaryotic dsDNA virus sp.]|nr:MAG: hypothetical protein Unbinned706contig1000_50 [Prokaryotic dsDNA virus sp.]|tara:strand:+ start:271 stop:519 length:249 start_codon:yes stop_codon:yes gene_type:complete
MKLTEFEKFEKCAKIKIKTGRVTIDCIKGLWGVDAPTLEQAIGEGKHYFLQYLGDGEYYDIIGGKSPVEILSEKLANLTLKE